MKKILFVVGEDENNYFGLKLLLNYPYGQTGNTEWKTILKDTKGSKLLEETSNLYDYIYEIQLSHNILQGSDIDKILIHNQDNATFLACSYASSPYVFYTNSHKPNKHILSKLNISPLILRYDKTPDAQYDFLRIKNDFLNIIYGRISKSMPKQLFTSERCISHHEKNIYQLVFKEYKQLDAIDKKLLSLPQQEQYIATFVNSRENESEDYCYINKKIRNIIHFDAWLKTP